MIREPLQVDEQIRRYLSLEYPAVVEQDARDGSGQWVAWYPDLPGCEGRGRTHEEAVDALDRTRAVRIRELVESGRMVPLPVGPEILPLSTLVVLDQLTSERALLEEALADVEAAVGPRTPVLGDWTTHDVAAHIAAWDGRGRGWIDEAVRGVLPAIPEAGMTWLDMDRLNQRTFLANRARPTSEVADEFAASYALLLATAERLSDADLARTLPLRWPEAPFPFPLWLLVAWRWLHYAEHRDELRAWLREHRGSASATA